MTVSTKVDDEVATAARENNDEMAMEAAIDEDGDVGGVKSRGLDRTDPSKDDRKDKNQQSRNRRILLVLSALTTFFYVGAGLAFGPMQLMVRNVAVSGLHCILVMAMG
jgi:hypothetical protein